MSSRVCHGCISYLNSWQSFKNRCIAAQKRHRGLLDQQIMRQRTVSSLGNNNSGSGKAPANVASASASGGGVVAATATSGVMNQQQILNHAAQQQRRQEAIMAHRQRILKETQTAGSAVPTPAVTQPKKASVDVQQNSAAAGAIDVVGVWLLSWCYAFSSQH